VISLQSFFEHARLGVLTALRCQGCGGLAIPPQDRCRTCGERAWAMVPLRGHGTITSVSIPDGTARESPASTPVAVALVRLDEGVSLLGHIIDIPVDRLRVGMAVRFQPVIADRVTAVGFGPAGNP
jgi:uncharacterized OB-fold protein